MKKTIFIFTVFFTVFISNATEAGEKTRLGIKLNANMSNVRITNMDGAGFHPGMSLAGFTNICFSEKFSFQPELSISYTETKIMDITERLKYKYVSIEVPMYIQFRIKAGLGNVVLGAGPHIGYGLSVDTRTEALLWGAPGENKVKLDHWYTGGGITGGGL